MSLGRIFQLSPFEPKRWLILPTSKGEIQLYVLDGKAYPIPASGQFECIHLDGWAPGFKNTKLNIPVDRLIRPSDGLPYYPLEVAFRLVNGWTAEIVAVSYDGGETFYDNELCTLPQEYDD